jgi:hypothetical protein
MNEYVQKKAERRMPSCEAERPISLFSSGAATDKLARSMQLIKTERPSNTSTRISVGEIFSVLEEGAAAITASRTIINPV